MAPSIVLVDTTNLLDNCLVDLSSNEARTVRKLAIDLEGVALCRYGHVSLLQIMADGSNIIWLVDITALEKLAFDHTDAEGRSLRGVLQSSETTKVLYDVRNDADALFNLYGIVLANIYDLQLLEVAMRRSNRLTVRFVAGLGTAIGSNLNPPAEWQLIKNAGIALFQPERGGSYEIFEQRPLDPRILAYAAQDVALLFQLERVLEAKIGVFGANWKKRVMVASTARGAMAHNRTYEGKGRHRAIAPGL